MPKDNNPGIFSKEAIERMKKFFVFNAGLDDNERLDCITCLNTGMRLLLNMPKHPVGKAIHKTMNSFHRTGHASEPHVIEFNDQQGKLTAGIKPPKKLRESILDAMLEMSNFEKGWSVYGLSIMDGYHSVTLTLYSDNASNPHIFWSDQWPSKSGWQEYTREDLDEDISLLTQEWWDEFPASRKPRTCTTIWRILP